MKLTKSNKFTSEYCCSIVKIGEIKPIPNKDLIGFTYVNGEQIVVRKDQVKEGDILFYASNETQLNLNFLSKNSLFEDKTLNFDNTKKGFFAKTGRVRAIKLGGVKSMGYLFSLEELTNWYPGTLNIESLVGEDFDMIDDIEFIKAYIPFVPQQRKSKSEKRNNKLNRFNRLVKGEFSFHYDTDPLAKNIDKIHPDDIVNITVKVHGTSFICGKLHVKVPFKLPFYKRIWNKFVDITGLFRNNRITDYSIEYGNVTSSRTVIKNQYINSGVTSGYYDTDIWSEFGELIYPYLSEGMTLYGEIVGYEDTNRMIQKGYDYGCLSQQRKLMPYRITTIQPNGEKVEWEISQVKEWTENLLKENPNLESKIFPIIILYEGTLRNRYPNLSIENHWHENVLLELRNDKNFGMELNEPLCRNKVPREGIVLRKVNDPIVEAFKLKTEKFLDKERKLIDSGEVDMEILENNK